MVGKDVTLVGSFWVTEEAVAVGDGPANIISVGSAVGDNPDVGSTVGDALATGLTIGPKVGEAEASIPPLSFKATYLE